MPPEGVDSSGRRVLRPDSVILAAMIVGGVAIAVWAFAGLRSVTTIADVIARIFIVGLGLASIAMAARERVEIDRDSIRLIRLTSSETIDRRDIRYVSKSGGRGRPAGLILSQGVEANTRYVDATAWPPRVRRATGAAGIPASMRPKRLAHALGVECRPHPTRRRDPWR